jgi:hypothetical protein
MDRKIDLGKRQRLLLCTLHPFMAAELGKRFNIEEALNYGLLPITLSDPAQFLESYISLYIREEVQMEGLIAQHLRA